jgi:hypothetical protein
MKILSPVLSRPNWVPGDGRDGVGGEFATGS